MNNHDVNRKIYGEKNNLQSLYEEQSKINRKVIDLRKKKIDLSHFMEKSLSINNKVSSICLKLSSIFALLIVSSEAISMFVLNKTALTTALAPIFVGSVVLEIPSLACFIFSTSISNYIFDKKYGKEYNEALEINKKIDNEIKNNKAMEKNISNSIVLTQDQINRLINNVNVDEENNNIEKSEERTRKLVRKD